LLEPGAIAGASGVKFRKTVAIVAGRAIQPA
jgi:hypothetical protein